MTTTSVRIEPGARSTGIRLGALFGPAVFGVTAAGVALPDVARDLQVTPAAVAWVLTAHAVALGVGTALFGRLADALGVRTALLSGAVVTVVGAVVCVASPNLAVLVAGRFLLASGSGAMTSCALTLVAAGDPDKRPTVLAGFGATMAVFSASATLLGGVVTQWLTWRLTVVLPVLSVLVIPLCLGLANRPGSRRPVDVTGAAVLTLTVSSLILLIQSPSLSLPTGLTIAAGAAMLAGAGVLALRVRSSPTGFLPRSLITDRVYLLAATVGIGVYGGLFASMWAVPQVLAEHHGWPVLLIGLALLPGAFVGAVLSRLAGRGGTKLLTAVAAASALCLAAAGFLGGGWVLLVTGTSLGFAAFAVTQVVTTGVMSVHIPPDRRGGALGILNMSFFVGGGIGAAVAGALSKVMPMTGALAVVALLPLVSAFLARRIRR
ncbi:MFS transporter [Kibdelosporangium phytohabitans]|uniref:Gramicidin biosynthesis protein n=1 Tax=Kibdelosporangium phytohabitans TaxID=860235 RepID=A0A0N9IAK5_9PSEU|nr:MFS transporter [Kibdelosporangium phytohabitans]ALG13397.1 gramicidin biosynthesis protein [Kibdelosporangium phytohabitans]MBE1465196.1 DHA2 family metal-tetracycline-proton antiporter-like MFS transporter [Kibdelosporangium phytohabitans]